MNIAAWTFLFTTLCFAVLFWSEHRLRIAAERNEITAMQTAAKLMLINRRFLSAARMALNDRMYKDWPTIADALMGAIAIAEPESMEAGYVRHNRIATLLNQSAHQGDER